MRVMTNMLASLGMVPTVEASETDVSLTMPAEVGLPDDAGPLADLSLAASDINEGEVPVSPDARFATVVDEVPEADFQTDSSADYAADSYDVLSSLFGPDTMDSTAAFGDGSIPVLAFGTPISTSAQLLFGSSDFGSYAGDEGLASMAAGSRSPALASDSDHRAEAAVDFAAALPSDSWGGAQGDDYGITIIDSELAAKGGNGGRGGNGGGGNGGDGGSDGGDTGGVMKSYLSGAADGTDGYDIFLDFKGSGWTVDLQQAFVATADYLTTVIDADIGGGGRYRGTTIDDLYVSAELSTIDGSGGILGQAGPSSVWTATDLTATGVMQFDVVDADTFFGQGLWDDIVTHEFMHVLGFGSLWDYGSHELVDNFQYTGTAGRDAYRDFIGDQSVSFIPVEQDGGSGTAGSHWDEGILDNELMTGYINNDGDLATNNDNFLSEFSVASLGDLGYSVSYQDYPGDDIVFV